MHIQFFFVRVRAKVQKLQSEIWENKHAELSTKKLELNHSLHEKLKLL